MTALATGILIASPTSAQNRQPATRVTWEGDMNGRYYCKLDNGVTRHKGEGSCSEFLGVCTHENGYKVNCSDCTPFGNWQISIANGLRLRIRLRFHNHAPKQACVFLACHQPAAHQLWSHNFCWTAEEGMGQGWEIFGDVLGGYRSG